MFCKASTIPVSEEFTESSELQLFSFDPEKTPLFFLPVEKSAKAARLPLGTAVICVARAAIAETGLPLFPRDEEGVYLAGNKSDVAKFLSAVKKSAACMETGVSFALPDQPVSEGVSSGALHELLVFAISTLLFSKGYSLVMGHFCLEFNKADPHRPGVLVKVLISNTRAKIETSVATIRGSSNNQLAFVPDAARFALPHCRPCRVRDVTDSLNPNEMLGTKQDLVTYWQSNYGLGSVISESRLFARVVYGTLHFTYPSAALLATALVVDDKHRSGATLEREEKLHERVKRDLEALSILAKRREE